MLRNFGRHLAVLRRSWCAIAASIRSNATCAEKELPAVANDVSSNDSSSAAAEPRDPTVLTPLESDTVSTATQSQSKLTLRVSQYKTLITDYSVTRDELTKLVNFVRISRHLGYTVPKSISVDDMLELYGKESITKRHRYLKYLRQKEERAYRKLYPKTRPVHLTPLPRKEVTTDIPAEYGLHLNSFMTRIRECSMNTFYEQRLVANMPFTHKIALDFGYDHAMNAREARKAAEDVRHLYSYNRRCSEPFNLTLCSLATPEPEGTEPTRLIVPSLVYRLLIDNRGVAMPCEYTSRSVSDVFPPEQVVYLSPEGEDVLETLDEDKVYVLGVLVDKEYQPGMSAERARQLGVRSARFPARVRLFWEGNEKPLHLEHCLKVLHHVKSGKTWQEAISRISKHFVVDTEDS